MGSVTIDWLSVLVAAVLNMVIGFIWYSKWVFGPTWLKLAKAEGSEMGQAKLALLSTFASSLLIAFFLDFFEAHIGVTTVTDGAFMGFCAWLGFVATTQVSAVIWLKKPISLFLIDTGSKLLSFVVMGGILGA